MDICSVADRERLRQRVLAWADEVRELADRIAPELEKLGAPWPS